MISTEGTETTDFTAMNRDEIREHLTAAIGDDWLSDEDRESLVLEVEDLDAVTPDGFWGIVASVLDADRANALAACMDEAQSVRYRVANVLEERRGNDY